MGKYVEKKLAEEKEAPKKEVIATSETIAITSIKNVQTNVAFTISDIDPLEKTTVMDPVKKTSSATITFTPVSNGENSPVITVSSTTKQIDLTGEVAIMEDISSNSQASRVELEKSDFDHCGSGDSGDRGLRCHVLRAGKPVCLHRSFFQDHRHHR